MASIAPTFLALQHHRAIAFALTEKQFRFKQQRLLSKGDGILRAYLVLQPHHLEQHPQVQASLQLGRLHTADNADQFLSFEGAVHLVEPGSPRLQHRDILHHHDVVDVDALLDQVQVDAQDERLAFLDIFANSDVEQLVLELSLVGLLRLYLLHELLLVDDLELGIAQQEEEVIGLHVPVAIPHATGERALPPKTDQFSENFWAALFNAPVLLERLVHDRQSRVASAIELFVALHQGIHESRILIPQLLQLRHHLGCLHHAPALRVALELRLCREDLVDGFVKGLAFDLGFRAKLLRKAFQHEARHERAGAIDIIAFMAAQAAEALDEGTCAIRLKDEVVDAKIDADIDGRGADQDGLFEGTAPLLAYLVQFQLARLQNAPVPVLLRRTIAALDAPVAQAAALKQPVEQCVG